VVGGEWSQFSAAPDFIWNPEGDLTDMRYDRSKDKLVPSYVRASVIKKLHQCSIQAYDIKEIEIEKNGEQKTIEYVECEM